MKSTSKNQKSKLNKSGLVFIDEKEDIIDQDDLPFYKGNQKNKTTNVADLIKSINKKEQ